MSDRIKNKLNNLNHKLLIPFFTANYPDKKTFHKLIKIAIDQGSDIIEIGIPFSDPLADGPEIQFSSRIALKNGTDLNDILLSVEKIRNYSEIPIVLMGYYNPIIAYGEKKFYSDANQSGVDGLIIPDIPIEEGREFKKNAETKNLSAIFLTAPTTINSRLSQISNFSTDFVYAVTVTGVTGTGKVFGKETDNYFKNLRKYVDKKVVAGFGVSNVDNAKRLSKLCDGVVIGSALVKLIRTGKSKTDALSGVGNFLKRIRKAI